MKHNTLELLDTLVGGTEVRNSNISAEAKSTLFAMRNEFARLRYSNETNKQAKMIALLMGGVILALKRDDWKYYYNSKFRLYPQWLTNLVFKNVKEKHTEIEAIYLIGQEALRNLPDAFNSRFFTFEYPVISSSKKAVFFPDLKTKTAEINSLVKFCIEHSNDLECPEIEIDDDSNLDYHTRSAHHAMEDLLGSYLRNRQNVTNSKGQVKEYFYPFFIPGQKSFTQKRDAVNDLISALKGENVDITQHLSTYRNGQLGDSLRAFIKSSRADEIVGQSVETVSDFIQKLQSKNKWAQLGLD